ncbi:phospholipase A2 inhibitor and Ly6/PLAUR domain-containing protein [Python bivittatus]|uniref:Phospholipase A2 inhibitor and Ly6/PLAUR domain-containing protein n=1 Tax=Python bivittatus TaxID=176946 RepID=A0A9F3QTX8_PYTBI|nr:phospholipase A2 inhibitor and Ly6/PLAUR domain-containing protein [Python bivittatus]XP_025031809.1 phospholipase A2 inhibitor and Ly6/PLAUR domain-containing protein [Python bivittatus]
MLDKKAFLFLLLSFCIPSIETQHLGSPPLPNTRGISENEVGCALFGKGKTPSGTQRAPLRPSTDKEVSCEESRWGLPKSFKCFSNQLLTPSSLCNWSSINTPTQDASSSESTDLQIMGPTSMATLPSLSLLLAALLTQGSCLICESCASPGNDCTGLSHTCKTPEDACFTSVGISSLGADKITETIKTCIAGSNCQPGPISVTINSEIHFWSTSSCCQDDLCNSKKLDLPPVNTTPNGLTCSACFNIGFDQCEMVDSLNCTGEDNHCITTSGTLSIGDNPVPFAAKGCSSASACSLPLETSIYSAGVTFHLNKIGCKPATRASST